MAPSDMDIGSRSPLSPSDVDESISGGSSSAAISPVVIQSTKHTRNNSQRQLNHTITSSLGPSSDLASITIVGDDDDVGQSSTSAVATAVNEPQGRGSHESSQEGGSRPVIRVVTVANGEGDGANQAVAPVQHVDSGVRLAVEEVRLPAELPPVYSPT